MPAGHINNLKDAQAMKSSFDRIRKKEEADSSKKTGNLFIRMSPFCPKCHGEVDVTECIIMDWLDCQYLDRLL